MSTHEALNERQQQFLCPNCLASIGKLTHFCPACGAPISAYASTDPLGRVHAEGFALRNATRSPNRPIVLIGIWMLFAPSACVLLLIGISTLLTDRLTFGNLLGSCVALLGGMLFAAIVFKTTRNYLSGPASSDGTSPTSQEEWPLDEAEPSGLDQTSPREDSDERNP